MLEGSGKEVTSIRMIEAITKGHMEVKMQIRYNVNEDAAL